MNSSFLQFLIVHLEIVDLERLHDDDILTRAVEKMRNISQHSTFRKISTFSLADGRRVSMVSCRVSKNNSQFCTRLILTLRHSLTDVTLLPCERMPIMRNSICQIYCDMLSIHIIVDIGESKETTDLTTTQSYYRARRRWSIHPPLISRLFHSVERFAAARWVREWMGFLLIKDVSWPSLPFEF